eukprot:scaffold5904_cov350-Prasinococcus_capsulatus_cf.AAC.1
MAGASALPRTYAVSIPNLSIIVLPSLSAGGASVQRSACPSLRQASTARAACAGLEGLVRGASPSPESAPPGATCPLTCTPGSGPQPADLRPRRAENGRGGRRGPPGRGPARRAGGKMRKLGAPRGRGRGRA